MDASACATCRRPSAACVCDRIVVYPTVRRVLVLQHFQEQYALLGSAQLLESTVRIGALDRLARRGPRFAALHAGFMAGAAGEDDADRDDRPAP